MSAHRRLAILLLASLAVPPGPAAAAPGPVAGAAVPPLAPAPLTSERLAAEDLDDLTGLRVFEIRLAGNRYTRDATILRELLLQPGEPFDADLLERDLRFLEGLGIFAAVSVAPWPTPAGLILAYRVVERGDARIGLFYPLGELRDDQLQAGIAYRHRNLRGRRDELRVKRTLGWEDRYEARLIRPWLGTLPLGHSLGWVYREREEPEDRFRIRRFELAIWMALERRRPQAQQLMLQASLGDREFIDEGRDYRERTNAVTLGYARDGRDSYLRPTRGSRLRVYATLFDPGMGSSVSLRRTRLCLCRYQRLPRGWVGALALDASQQWGALFHKGVYDLGGMETVRGHADGTFAGWEGHDLASGPRGRNRGVVHLELRRSVLPRLTFSLPVLGIVDLQGDGLLFLDGGLLWSGSELLPRGRQARALGFGVGLRLFTPFEDVLRAELGLRAGGRYEIHLGTGLDY
ncbi:MAG: BamA/TamA family outer membrane protein [Candidatus Krumholzibacteriota bacterium]|nr:BamA/TamA family outer membrane protein [Candidatus Krumholzibacteriota bacterium]